MVISFLVTAHLAAPLAAPPAVSPRLARNVRLAAFVSGLAEPIGMGVAPGDPARRIFVIEKGGRVRIVKGGRVLPRPYLDLSGQISSGMEQGLLGIAFSPEFATDRHFYVNYTDRRGDTRIVRYTQSAGDADRAESGSAAQLHFIKQPFRNHNGGHLAFGPDGALWVGTGDGGGANDPFGNAQNPRSQLGKMLRFDVQAGTGPEIAMTGLRNPWRYSFDRRTGDMYIGDVGQNRWEEVHVLPAGGLRGVNLGWSIMEAHECLKGHDCNTSGLTLPTIVLGRQDGSCSVIGGYVYRGKALPELTGTYFYSDWCSAILQGFKWAGGAARDAHDWKVALDPGGRLSQVASFGEDHDGELYVVCQSGTIYRFERAR
jgi:glucose/arabinose dehydrogenase